MKLSKSYYSASFCLLISLNDGRSNVPLFLCSELALPYVCDLNSCFFQSCRLDVEG